MPDPNIKINYKLRFLTKATHIKEKSDTVPNSMQQSSNMYTTR